MLLRGRLLLLLLLPGVRYPPSSFALTQEERDQLVDVSAFAHLLQAAYAEESAAGNVDDDGITLATTARVQAILT